LLPILKTAESISTSMLPTAPLLPRGAPTQWKQAHQSLSFHLRRHPNAWENTLGTADVLETRLQALFPMLDDLCLNTCPWCLEPCCRVAKVWFDFKDLLFLHFARKPIPLNPPLSALEDTCRFLSREGCTLPRSSRPWICTWYLCPVQTAILRKRDSLQYDAFNRIVREIKILREALEEEFIKVVT
jgi:hypothetical protein